MTLTRKDAFATLLTGLVVLAYAATHESWNVWLIGTSHRWATAAILLLGVATCSLGTASRDGSPPRETRFFAVVGIASIAFGLWALATGSLTPLSLLVASDVLLWLGATARHAWHGTHHPLTA